jgi:predicted DNA-binding transcriptional regulator AlpA
MDQLATQTGQTRRRRSKLPAHLMYVTEAPSVTGLSLREVWRKASSDPDFPKTRKLSTRVTVFVRDEVTAWLESRGLA